MIVDPVDDHAGERDVEPDRKSHAREASMLREAPFRSQVDHAQDQRHHGDGEQRVEVRIARNRLRTQSSPGKRWCPLRATCAT